MFIGCMYTLVSCTVLTCCLISVLQFVMFTALNKFNALCYIFYTRGYIKWCQVEWHSFFTSLFLKGQTFKFANYDQIITLRSSHQSIQMEQCLHNNPIKNIVSWHLTSKHFQTWVKFWITSIVKIIQILLQFSSLFTVYFANIYSRRLLNKTVILPSYVLHQRV